MNEDRGKPDTFIIGRDPRESAFHFSRSATKRREHVRTCRLANLSTPATGNDQVGSERRRSPATSIGPRADPARRRRAVQRPQRTRRDEGHPGRRAHPRRHVDVTRQAGLVGRAALEAPPPRGVLSPHLESAGGPRTHATVAGRRQCVRRRGCAGELRSIRASR